MKKLLILSILCFSSFNLSSQIKATTEDGRKVILNDNLTYTWVKSEEKSVSTKVDSKFFIGKHVDEMTDKVYYYPSERIICIDKKSDVGFSLSLSLNGKDDNSVKVVGLNMKVVGLSCVENVSLIFLFDDGTKMNITSWNKFNCDGNAYYNLRTKELNQISTKSIKKVRVQNGRNLESYTHILEGSDKSHFINMYKSVADKKVVVKQLE